MCDAKVIKNENGLEDDSSSLPLDLAAKNGDTSLISEAMAEEEEKLLVARIKEEEGEEFKVKKEASEQAYDPDVRFSKLDELLTQTQLYSEFLLEKMDDISLVMASSLMVSNLSCNFCSNVCRNSQLSAQF